MSSLPIYLLFLCLALLQPLEGEVNQSAVEAVIRKREQLVEDIAKKAEELYLNRREAIRSCQCSRHDCAYELGDETSKQCTEELIFESCETDCGERIVDYNKTGIRTPYATNPQVLTGLLKESICTYSGLEDAFRKVKNEYGLTNSWTYIGLRDGHFRTWPLRARARAEESKDPYLKDCKPYDPRRRPWYSAASTGPKDVVLLVDGSASTTVPAGTVGESSTLWAVLQGAVEHLLDTFIHADFVNVVQYSNDARILWNEAPFAEANPVNRNILKDRIRRLRPSGSTNIAVGFEAAIDLFRRGYREGTTTDCNRIIIFLTEGRDTKQRTSEILASIEKSQAALEKETNTRAVVFVYTFGITSDISTAQQIACGNQGFWSFVRNFDNPLTDMIHYLETVATSRGNQGPVWVDPYEDAGGLGILTTVSVPVFSRGKPGEVPLLLGVVGHDVRLNDLVVDGYDSDQVLRNLVERSKRCTRLSFRPCDLQVNQIDKWDTDCDDGDRFIDRSNLQACNAPTSIPSERVIDIRIDGIDVTIVVFVSLRPKPSVEDVTERYLQFDRTNIFDFFRPYRRLTSLGSAVVESSAAVPSNLNSKITTSLKKRCVTLDRRSTSGNIESHFCDEIFDFICEFLTTDDCKDDILDVTNEEGLLKTFAVPNPMECPEMERAINDTTASPEAGELLSESIICPFGRPVFHEELYCCVNCLNTTVPDNSARIYDPSFTFLFILFLISPLVLI